MKPKPKPKRAKRAKRAKPIPVEKREDRFILARVTRNGKPVKVETTRKGEYHVDRAIYLASNIGVGTYLFPRADGSVCGVRIDGKEAKTGDILCAYVDGRDNLSAREVSDALASIGKRK